MATRVLPRARRTAAALAACLLLAGCGVAEALRPDPTWVPKPEGPPPADLPQPDRTGPQPQPGEPGSPDGPGVGTEDDPNVVATHLTLPWGLVVLPDGTALVGERTTGRLLVVQPRRAPARPVQTIAGLDTTGDGGLLGLALSPNYRDDQLVYAYVTTRTDNRVVRFEIGRPPVPVLTGIPKGRTGNGGRIAFGPDGLLYVGTGDAGKPALAAARTSLAGKVLRLTVFGRPAPGNPDPTSLVFSIGHRAVAGLCLAGPGQVYTTEPASASSDEVNKVEAGRDYGWPPAGGGTRSGAAVPDRTLPVATAGVGGCAVIERGLFVASLTGQRMWAFPLDSTGHAGAPSDHLNGAYGRLRTVVAAPDGALWLTTSNKDGRGRPTAQDDRVIRIQPPAGTTNSPA
ncbi:MAG TPA: PQQ-dependent sugar dehydrogenase [Mycobacteriales bacterium]